MGAALAPLVPALLQAATAFSPLRIAFTALAPVLPVISLALTAGVRSRSGRASSAPVAAVAPSIVAITNGLVAFLVPLLKTPALVQTVAVGFLAWKAATAGFAFASLVAGLVQTTVQLGVNAAAWVRNAAAQVASKVQTVAIMAMYAGEFVANLIRSGVALGVQAAQWIASTAAMVAARVAMVAGAVATGASRPPRSGHEPCSARSSSHRRPARRGLIGSSPSEARSADLSGVHLRPRGTGRRSAGCRTVSSAVSR
jgi:hypothetical protein